MNKSVMRWLGGAKFTYPAVRAALVAAWLPVAAVAQVNSGSNGSLRRVQPDNQHRHQHGRPPEWYLPIHLRDDLEWRCRDVDSKRGQHAGRCGLVQTNVVINGTLDVSGQTPGAAPANVIGAAGGPGGFRGGSGGDGGSVGLGNWCWVGGTGGGFRERFRCIATTVACPSPTELRRMGINFFCRSLAARVAEGWGSGTYANTYAGGGGGGGAMLIAASQTGSTRRQHCFTRRWRRLVQLWHRMLWVRRWG